MKRWMSLVAAVVYLVTFKTLADAQVKKGKARPATTKQLMAGIVRPACAGSGDALKKAPADSRGWADLETRAAVLNEASYLLMDDGRCPDGEWANAVKTLRGCSAEVIKQADARYVKATQAAFKALTESCGACYKAHKK